MNKYTKEYIDEKMSDFLDFRTALRASGSSYSLENEILLYSMWRH